LTVRNNLLTPDTQKECCFAFWAIIGNVVYVGRSLGNAYTMIWKESQHCVVVLLPTAKLLQNSFSIACMTAST
jgi:hypothetical protein